MTEVITYQKTFDRLEQNKLYEICPKEDYAYIKHILSL
jgi:hypothetical protein